MQGFWQTEIGLYFFYKNFAILEFAEHSSEMAKELDAHDTIRLFIVEDHPSLLGCLRLYFKTEREINLCGSADSAAGALQDIEQCSPNIVCADLGLSDMDGIELISKIRQKHPDIRCIIYSANPDLCEQDRAREAGASGYVIKGNPELIGDAVRTVGAGGTCFARDLVTR